MADPLEAFTEQLPITGREVQPQVVDFGILRLAHRDPYVYVAYNRLSDLWLMTPLQARETAAALEALALQAEGRKPS